MGSGNLNVPAKEAIIHNIETEVLLSGEIPDGIEGDDVPVANAWVATLNQIDLDSSEFKSFGGIKSTSLETVESGITLQGLNSLPAVSILVTFNNSYWEPKNYAVPVTSRLSAFQFDLIRSLIFPDPPSASYPNSVYVQAIQSGIVAINQNNIVGINGVSGNNPVYSTIARITSATQTGVLGVAFLTGAPSISSNVPGTLWAVQTAGQFFDSSIINQTIGTTIYFDNTGTPTTTSAGNTKFGYVTFSDANGSWINITGFTQ